MRDFWELVPANPWERDDGLLPRLPGAGPLPDWMQAVGFATGFAPSAQNYLAPSFLGPLLAANAEPADQEGGASKPLSGGIFGPPAAPQDLVERIWPRFGQTANRQGSSDEDSTPAPLSDRSDATAPTAARAAMTPITGASEKSTYPRSVPDIGDFLGLRDTAPPGLIDASPYPGLDAGQRGPAILATKLNTPANAQTPTRNSGGLGKQRIPSTQPAGGKPWPGLIVTLPNGSSVADPDSITGYLTSPVSDPSAVAAAGRETGQRFRQLQENSETAPGALGYFLARFFHNVATGGAFDYQRSGNQILGLLGAGFTQLPHFRNVSNFNVGLFCHQAGMSLDETLRTAGRYAWLFSGHYDPNQPYGLPGPTRQFIEAGFQTGQSGAFGQP